MHSDMEDLPEELCTPSNLIDNHLDRGAVGDELIKMLGDFGFAVVKADNPRDARIASLEAALRVAREGLAAIGDTVLAVPAKTGDKDELLEQIDIAAAQIDAALKGE